MRFQMKTVVFIVCLVVGAVCQDTTRNDTQTENGLNTESTVYEPEFPTGSTDASSVGNNSSEGTTENGEEITNSTIDNSEDIVITGTGVPDVGEITDENTDETDEPDLTTIYDDDTTTTSTISGDEETKITACFPNPCRNGGSCYEDGIVPRLFYCTCPAGYTGVRCGTEDKCVKDENDEQCKGGACVYSKDASLRFCKCFYGTYWDEVNSECRESDPPCFPNPCLNGGTCSSNEDQVLCDCLPGFQGNNCSVQVKCGDCQRGTCVLDDKRTTKYCKCNEGLYWSEEKQTCKEIFSPCDLGPCHNGGACNATSDAEYNCTCASGFSGASCDVTDWCSTRQDCRHGDCVLSEDAKTRSCQCEEGFYLHELTHRCEAITSLCEPTPCLNEGVCTGDMNSYNCMCYWYFGLHCETRDLCTMDGGNDYCGNGKCKNNLQLGMYFCTCKDEEYFQYTERKCAVLDLCPLKKCSSTETCSMGNCTCKEDYKWNNVTEKCEPDFCSSKPCPLPEMTCEEGTGSTDYKCFCQEGYAFNGTHCNEAICIFPDLNDCDQVCSPKEIGYECGCEDEFDLQENNQTCLYRGNYTCTNKTCDKGFCVEKNDMEECLCPPGHVEVNGTCKDVCSTNQLPPGICPLEKCESTPDGFRCKCEGKFALSADKTTCIARNVCHDKEVGWNTCRDRNAECFEDWDSSEGFICRCGKGQVPTEGGVCRDICSLESNQRQCSIKGATCDVDTEGRMVCRCPPYFKENERDGKCTQPADFSYLVTLPLDRSTYQTSRNRRSLDVSVDYSKILKDVTLTIRDMFVEFVRANILSCNSSSGYSYILCKVEMQFATEHETDLKRLQTKDVCLTDGNSNSCLLPPLLVLAKNMISTKVDIQPTDPCDEDIHEFVCGSETSCVSSLSQKSFNCSCKPGFYSRRKNYPFGNTRSFIETCADIDECMEGDPCPASSNCLNTIGNYTCTCKPGFRSILGSNPSKCVEICNPNPCTHGDCTTRGDHEYDCRCEAGYKGTFCNLQDENFKRARNNTIIVGVVLGGILLITFILFAACISRLRKKKYYENRGPMYYNSAEMTERRRDEGGAINNAFQRE